MGELHEKEVTVGKPKASRKVVSVREALRKARRDGWKMTKRTATNHRQFKHPTKKGKVTISGNPGDELDPKTLESIQTQMQVSQDEWDEL